MAGSLGITGWALSEVGIAAVEIFRDPMPGEGTTPVFIGTAAMVEGVRSDVQAAYTALPFAARAGWGYMLPTNTLPNNGDGTFRILAYARDLDGRTTLLGSRRITCDNTEAKVPFGAIDTPGQGEIISGAIINFGWALSPQPNSIPVDGSTIDVMVDDVVVGHPVYGFERGDITSMFPGYKNTKTAVGYFPLDTRLMTNGLHTIAWVVRDTAGHAQGIGSRFVTVRNELAPNAAIAESVSVPVASAPERPLAAKPATSSRTPAASTASTPAIGAAPADTLVPTVTASGAPLVTPVSIDTTSAATMPAAAAIGTLVTPSSTALAKRTSITPDQKTTARDRTSDEGGRKVEFSTDVTKTQPSLTVSASTVTTGGTITVTVENGRAGATDRVMFYSSTAQPGAGLDWKYLNGERTAPADGASTAVVTLTAPASPGRYVVRLMSGGDSEALATSAVITVAPRSGPNDTSRIREVTRSDEFCLCRAKSPARQTKNALTAVLRLKIAAETFKISSSGFPKNSS